MIVDPKDQNKPLTHYFLLAETTKRVYDGLSKLISLANSFFIITSLSVFHFGFYQLILSFISVIRSLGMKFFDGLITVDMRRYFNVQKPDFAKKIFTESAVLKISIAILITLLVFFGAPAIANFYGKDTALFIKWASILSIVYAVQSIIAIFLQSIVSFAQESLSSIREITKLLIIVSFLLFYKFTILEVIIAHVISEATATLILLFFVFLKKYRQAFQKINSYESPLMMPMIKTHGGRVLLINGLKEVLRDINPWLVKLFVSTEAVAYYSLAVNLTAIITDFMPLAGIKPLLLLKADNEQGMSFVFQRAIKYVFWIGVAFLAISFIGVPVAIKLIVPKYIPALPVFFLMILAFPIFGVVDVLHYTLASLREYGILAMRLVNEVLISVVGLLVLLPTIGVIGTGIVYVARHVERTWFLYTRLVKRYPKFKIKLRSLFKIDDIDKQFFQKFFRHFWDLIQSFIPLVSQKKS